MKRILIPCNFSLHSERAIKFAIEITHFSEGELFICTVLPPSETEQSPTEKASAIAKTQDQFVSFIAQFDVAQLTVHHTVKTGKITTCLLEVIQQDKIDLVVMGTSGSRGWSEAFMGSNIGKIVRTSPVPVFAVKSNTTINQIKNIVFPCSINDDDSYLIEKIKGLQSFFNARLHLLHVNTNPRRDNQAGIQRLNKYAEQHGLRQFHVNVTHNAIEKDGIMQFAKEINADLIAMGTHGNRNPGNMYVSSIAADIANYANILTWTCATEASES